LQSLDGLGAAFFVRVGHGDDLRLGQAQPDRVESVTIPSPAGVADDADGPDLVCGGSGEWGQGGGEPGGEGTAKEVASGGVWHGDMGQCGCGGDVSQGRIWGRGITLVCGAFTIWIDL